MLCKNCGGDGWKTLAGSHTVVTMICNSCNGTGCAHPESDEYKLEEPFHEENWEEAQLYANRSINDYVSRRNSDL